MQTYQVLARKYRPSSFKDLVGQEHLVTTLRGALQSGKVAHAFILSGIRGVGKTTSARIIAKTINCEEGNGIEPCGKCSNCVTITGGNNIDVVEIDAASRTGVDHIREEIIDKIHYLPAAARYKIYIIDEVHMLSTNAFNALLKTLEEPPSFVKFIFATTEVHKIPVTILSRCQHFILRRLRDEEISQALASIAIKENLTTESGALAIIAAHSDGSMRDSLSLLDQVIAYSATNDFDIVTTDLVSSMLGMNQSQKILSLFSNLTRGNVQEALFDYALIYERGTAENLVIEQLLEITHATSVYKITGELAKSLTPLIATTIASDLSKISLGSLQRLWQMLIHGTKELAIAKNTRSTFEMLLIRICYSSALPELSEIMKISHSATQNLEPSTLSMKQIALNNPATKAAMEIFGNAKIIDITTT